MNSSRRLFLVTLVLINTQLSAQIMPAQDDVALAKKYQGKFDKSALVAEENETHIEFKLLGKDHQPVIIEDESNTYISLRAKSSFSKSKYFNENSEIVSATGFNKKGKALFLNRICGNYESESIFYSDAKLCKYQFNFAYLGEIQSFKAQKKINDVKYFTSVYFTDAIPSINRKITFRIPDWMEVELKEFNFKGFDIKKDIRRDEKNKTTVYEYSAVNIDAFKSESYSRGPSFTYPHILVLSKSFVHNGEKKPLISSVKDLYQWYASLVSMVRNDRNVLEKKVKELVEGKMSDEDKIKAIYYWVQDNIRYIAFEEGIAGFKPEAAHLVFTNKYGDCKGMANLTKEMLTIAGYDARLTWIGTNKIAYNYSIPTLAADNHMICTVILNGKRIYLDGTEKFISYEENAERIQRRQVLIEDGGKFILDSIPVAGNIRNKVNTELLLSLIEGNKLSGSYKTSLNGESKTGLLNSISNTPTDKKQNLLERVINQGNKSINVEKLKNSNLDEREKPFSMSCDYTASNKVSVFEKDMYVELEHEYAFKDFIIQPERVSDFDFDEKILRTSKVSLTIPKGYTISHLPENFEMKHNAFNFKLTFSHIDGMVHYEKEISINHGIIGKQDFDAWNQAIQGLKKAYNNKLVLTKIN